MSEPLRSIHAVVPWLGALTSLALATAVLAHPPRRRLSWCFALGMTGFALECLAIYGVLASRAAPARQLLWLQAMEGAGLALTFTWSVFVVALGHAGGRPPRAWRLAVAAGAAVSAAATIAVVVAPPFALLDSSLGAAALTDAGRYVVMAELLITVGILAALEGVLRTSRRDTRWRVKYLVLGLGGIFLVRFYFLSHLLLFHVLLGASLTTQAAAIAVANVLVSVSLVRGHFALAEVRLSRQVILRSVVLGVLGLYLLVVGWLGWLLNTLGVPEELFWGSLVIFVSALGLAAFLLSDDVRWRTKRVIARHFYRSKYDYREQWATFTTRLGSLLTLDELTPKLLNAVTDAVGATKAALYLADGRDGRYDLVAVLGVDRSAPALAIEPSLVTRLAVERAPFVLGNGEATRAATQGTGLPPVFVDGGVAVPLYWRATVTGLLLIGPERTGAAYTVEDLEFLATVGEQAAGVLATTRLAERAARSREFEAVHRVTSFVIHDVKNAVSALSMLSDNAVRHFDDPEFRRDAVRTLSRTVERMKGLVGKLASARDVSELTFEDVDLAAVVDAIAGELVTGPRLTLLRRLEPVPAILADPEAVERLLHNLLTNAREAVDGEGRITVHTGVRDGLVLCAVGDNGRGMSPEFVRASLFVPFRSTKKGGWGIGLYQAKEIAEAHGGRIEVESAEGAGTTFTVLFPPAERAAQVSCPRA